MKTRKVGRYTETELAFVWLKTEPTRYEGHHEGEDIGHVVRLGKGCWQSVRDMRQLPTLPFWEGNELGIYPTLWQAQEALENKWWQDMRPKPKDAFQLSVESLDMDEEDFLARLKNM